MSEKGKRIMELIAKVVKKGSEPTRNYLLGWAECAAYMVCGQQGTMERTGE